MLQTLQVGRAVAALMVVLFHLNGSIWGKPKYFPEEFFHPFAFGNAGVQFFFVLSGFIIFYVHRNDLGAPVRVKRFLEKRAFRIFPIYWLILAGITPLFFVASGLGTGRETSPSLVFTSFLLLPHPAEPVLSVAWSLRHEVLFYALFAIAILNLRIGLALLIAWSAGCLLALLVPALPFPFDFLASPNNILFGLGMACAWIVQQQTSRSIAWPLLLFGAALFLGTGLHELYASTKATDAAYILLFGLGSAFVIVGASWIERSTGVQIPKWLLIIGDASYVIYLVHLPLLSAEARAMTALGLQNRLSQTLLFLLLLSVAVAIGVALHLWLERPLLTALNRRKPQISAHA